MFQGQEVVSLSSQDTVQQETQQQSSQSYQVEAMDDQMHMIQQHMVQQQQTIIQQQQQLQQQQNMIQQQQVLQQTNQERSEVYHNHHQEMTMSLEQSSSELPPVVSASEDARPYRTNQIGEQSINKR